MTFEIETIDCTKADAPTKFVRSLRGTGFAALRNHPVDTALIQRLYADWAHFFADPSKLDWRFSPETQVGFFPFRSENAKDQPVKDLKEFFHVYPNHPLPPSVADATAEMYAALVDFGATLLTWIQTESPPEIARGFSEPLQDMIKGSTQSLFRILHYPPLETGFEPGAVRAAAHEDINLITLLVTGSEPGLQAKDTHGQWHTVPCDAGMIAVNVGDMLQLASGGWFPSTTHRVVNPPPEHNVSRYSMPMFVHPRPEVQLSQDLTAGGFLEQRLREIGLKA